MKRRIGSVIWTLAVACVLAAALGGEARAANPITSASGDISGQYKGATINNTKSYKLTGDVTLTDSDLTIGNGGTVTIDLNGHILRGTGSGSVITVDGYSAKLIITDTSTEKTTRYGKWEGDTFSIDTENTDGAVKLEGGIITGGNSESGGGIEVSGNGTLTTGNCNIVGNQSTSTADTFGGGGVYIAASPNVTLGEGTVIAYNRAKSNGGGVYMHKSSTTTLNISGSCVIEGNTANGATNNVDLEYYNGSGKTITVTGALAGSRIGVTLKSAPRTFTSGYGSKNGETDPSTYFFADNGKVILPLDNEAYLSDVEGQLLMSSTDVYWHLDEDGKLTITGVGDAPKIVPTYYSGTSVDWPWRDNSNGIDRTQIKKVKFQTDNANAKIGVETNLTLQSMFYGFSGLTTIEGLDKLNTTGVTTMRSMFEGCSSLTSLDVSGFNTSSVTTMNSMFYGCSSLTSLDVSNFNTSKVETMSAMFYDCSSLTSLNVSKFNTSSVTSMSHMFRGCSALTTITGLDKLNTSKVTNMSYIFSGCSALMTITGLDKFDTSKVQNMDGMFRECSTLTSLDVSCFNTSSATTMNEMFYNCSSLISLNVSNFNTSSVKYMQSMFRGCSALTTITGLDNFNTVAVTTMFAMFRDCWALTTITGLNNFNTAAVTTMDYMFYGCSALTELNLSGFDTSNVTNMMQMFNGCSALTSLDVSSFNMSKVTFTSYMFSGCTNLRELTVGENFNKGTVKATFPFAMSSDGATPLTEQIPAETAATYYRWYTVTLNKDGGTINSGNITGYAYSIGAPLPRDVTKSGYTLADWYASSNLSGDSVTEIGTDETGDKIFYAKWTANTYTVTLDNQDAPTASSASVTATYGAGMPSATMPTRTGYTFGGYYTEQNGGGTQYYTANGTSARAWNLASDTTLYAKWTANTYTVTWKSQDGSATLWTSSVTYDTKPSYNGAQPTKADTPEYTYTFAGWAANAGQESGTAAASLPAVTGDVAYYAAFSETARTYAVTLNPDGGTINSGNVTSYTYGVGATLPTDVTKTNYHFDGWFTASSGGDKVETIPADSTGNKTYYAHWTYLQAAVTTTPTASTLTYTGTAQALVTAGAATNGTMQYQVGGTAGDWSDTVPERTTPSTYTVYYRAKGADGYADSAEAYITVTIGKAALTVTANDESITYGDAAPAYSVSYSGWVNSEDTSALTTAPTATSTYTQYDGVNTYEIAPSGGAAANYSFNYVNGTLTVTPKPITIAWSNTNVTYDGQTHYPTATADGTVNGDTVAFTYSSGRKDAGESMITASLATTGKSVNYTLSDAATKTTTLTILKAPLTVTANAESKTYGEAEPTLTYTVSGLQGNDTASVVTGALTRAAGDDAGTYDITQGDLSAGDNYNISFTGATFTINPKALTDAMVTLTSANIEHTGWPLSPEVTVKDGGTKLEKDTDYTLGGTTREVNFGDYTLTVTGTGNYTGIVNKAWSITKEQPTLDGTLSATAITYGQTLAASTISGTMKNKSGATVEGAFTWADSTIAPAVSDSDNTEYNVTFTPSDTNNYRSVTLKVKLTVNKAMLTVTADAKSKTYGDADPALTYTVSGLQGSDTETGVTGTLIRAAGDNVGSYAITQGDLSAGDNYTISFIGANLTIGQRAITIQANDQSVALNDAISNTASDVSIASGALVAGHSISAVTLTSSSTANATTSGTITPSAATITDGGNDVTANYSITYADGTLTVTKIAPTVVTAPTANTLTFNGTAQALVTAGSAAGGTMQYSLQENGDYTTTIPVGTDAGSYTVWYKVEGDANHSDSAPQSVSVTISPKEEVSPTPVSPSYSDSDSGSSAASITVPVSGDTNSVPVNANVSGATATVQAPSAAELEKVIGSGVKTGTVTIDVSELKQDISAVSIPAETVKSVERAVSDPSNDANALTVKLTDGSVTFDAEALAAIAEQAKGSDLKLNLDDAGEHKLNAAQQSAVKDMDVQTVYDIYMTSNGVRISDFKGGSAIVTIAFTLASGQTGNGVIVWYVTDDGVKTEIPATYDNMEVTFTVEHFSNYVVAYDAKRAASGAAHGFADCPQDGTCPIHSFTDADVTAWYHDGVHWALENGVMDGVGDGLFAPNGDTSRAMAAVMLWRLEGRPAVDAALTFADVQAGAWYAEGVRWAASTGIITGWEDAATGKPVFAPNSAVTREQLAAMLWRFAKYKEADVSIGEDTNILSYSDASDIAEYAIPAIQWARGAGIFNGMESEGGQLGLFPGNHASRAVVATMFMRYCTNPDR